MLWRWVTYWLFTTVGGSRPILVLSQPQQTFKGQSGSSDSYGKPPLNFPLFQYNINNVGRAAFLDCGRTLVPLLHLIIIPGELGFRSADAPKDYITPHLYNFYRYHPTELVS